MANIIEGRAENVRVGMVIIHPVWRREANQWVNQERRVIRVDRDESRDIVTIYDWPTDQSIPRNDRDLYKHRHGKMERIDILSYG